MYERVKGVYAVDVYKRQVHRPSRLVDIFTSMKNNHLEPKRIRLVYPHIDKPANMVLIRCV